MNKIQTLDELRTLYDDAVPGALTKVVDHITPLYRRWIETSKFAILTTVGKAGTDASPRGDIEPVARVIDPKTLWMPDWRGNNRLDSLSNIVEDGRASLMFMVPGSNNVVRINGNAWLTADQECTAQFEHNNKTPRTVIGFDVGEVYFQCAKALMRSKLWKTASDANTVPSAGELLKEVFNEFDAEAYDAGYPAHAKDRMW